MELSWADATVLNATIPIRTSDDASAACITLRNHVVVRLALVIFISPFQSIVGDLG
jgi:hypothetical protein